MVQILVKIKDDSMCIKEWAIIEVQGDLECNSGCSVGGKLIGQLFFSSKGRPVLIIGYHILYGRIIEDNLAIAVLLKHKDSNVGENPTSQPKKNSSEYTLLAIVKKRIVFKTRPKPIVTVE